MVSAPEAPLEEALIRNSWPGEGCWYRVEDLTEALWGAEISPELQQLKLQRFPEPTGHRCRAAGVCSPRRIAHPESTRHP